MPCSLRIALASAVLSPAISNMGVSPEQAGIVDELPRGRGVSAALDLDGHLDLRAGEANDGLGVAAIALALADENRDVWDTLQNTHDLGFEVPLLIHDISFFIAGINIAYIVKINLGRQRDFLEPPGLSFRPSTSHERRQLGDPRSASDQTDILFAKRPLLLY